MSDMFGGASGAALGSTAAERNLNRITMVFALLWAFILLIVTRRHWWDWPLLCFVLLIALFVLGLIDSFDHARDAWAIMPAAPLLSMIATLVAALACAVGLSTLRMRDPR